MAFPAALAATFPENWPPPLRELAAPACPIPLSQEDVIALGQRSGTFSRRVEPVVSQGISAELEAAIAAGLSRFPDGVMPRLGLCSWKGSMLANLPARTPGEVVQIITANDDRIGRALTVSAVTGAPAVLHLRAWRDIPPWSEFRIFLRAGRVIGVSQYHYRTRFAAIADREPQIRSALKVFLARLMPHAPLKAMVVDVWLRDAETGLAAELIELNPFGRETDACLFSWDRPETFDRSLRFVT